MNETPTAQATNANPFFEEWSGAFGVPPFSRIEPDHFRPAFDPALAEHEAEVDAIAGAAPAASFENTIAALERSGKLLSRVADVFYALAGAHTNDALQAIEREIAPRRARHWNRIYM